MTWRMVIMGVRPRREKQFCTFGNDSLAAASPLLPQSDLSSLAGRYRKTWSIPTLENDQSEIKVISDHEARDLIQPAMGWKNYVRKTLGNKLWLLFPGFFTVPNRTTIAKIFVHIVAKIFVKGSTALLSPQPSYLFSRQFING